MQGPGGALPQQREEVLEVGRVHREWNIERAPGAECEHRYVVTMANMTMGHRGLELTGPIGVVSRVSNGPRAVAVSPRARDKF